MIFITLYPPTLFQVISKKWPSWRENKLVIVRVICKYQEKVEAGYFAMPNHQALSFIVSNIIAMFHLCYMDFKTECQRK